MLMPTKSLRLGYDQCRVLCRCVEECVTFKDPQEKEKAMKNLSKLKGTKWSQQKISITHDYTKAQRARQKELVDKEKREKGDANGEVFFYKVRGRPWREQVIAVKKKIAEGETNQE